MPYNGQVLAVSLNICRAFPGNSRIWIEKYNGRGSLAESTFASALSLTDWVSGTTTLLDPLQFSAGDFIFCLLDPAGGPRDNEMHTTVFVEFT